MRVRLTGPFECFKYHIVVIYWWRGGFREESLIYRAPMMPRGSRCKIRRLILVKIPCKVLAESASFPWRYSLGIKLLIFIPFFWTILYVFLDNFRTLYQLLRMSEELPWEKSRMTVWVCQNKIRELFLSIVVESRRWLQEWWTEYWGLFEGTLWGHRTKHRTAL